MADLNGWVSRHAAPGTLRVVRAVRPLVRDRVGTAATHRKVKALPDGLRVELGSHTRRMPGWIAVDMIPGVDLYWDLRRPLPFRDGQVDELYSSHALEHFVYRDLMGLLAECRRVLASGAVMRVAVPDAGLYIRGYRGEVEIPVDYLGHSPGVCGSAPIDLVNYTAYMGGEHRHMFDIDGLLAVLCDAGFVDVGERPFDPTIDLADRRHETIYATATAPFVSSHGKAEHET